MPAGRIYLKTSSVDSLIYIFGGSTNPYDPPMSDVWEYNPALDSYKVVSPMPTGLVHASSGEFNGNIYIICGSETPWIFQPGSTVFEYNPHNDLSRLVENFNVNKRYAIPGTDNVLITTKINNPAGITLFAEIETPDQTPVYSLQLFDDGNHNDGIAGDSLFANSWPVPPVEESNYYIDLRVTRVDTNTVVNHLNNMALFTTIGPVVFVNYEIPQQGDNFFTLKYSLKNDGLSSKATSVTSAVSTSDTNVTNTPGNSVFGNIAPGEVKNQVSFPIIIYTQNNPGSIDFIVHIFSNGYFFWGDSFTVPVPTGIAENETNLPVEYALKQNYPNPFNPVTTIKYQIPAMSFVTLKVYDVLGSEIITLVNEEKPVGSYEVTFNAVELPSGIYFYRLQAGDFVETKKMVLMK
jgi:hypothetical protein